MAVYIVYMFLIVLIYKVFKSLYNVIECYFFFKKDKLILDNIVLNKEPFILLVIPVLMEQKIIIQTLQHLLHLEYHNYNVMISGSEKEERLLNNKDDKTTIDIVNGFIKEHNLAGKYYTYLCTNLNGSRSNQINDCIHYYKNNYGTPDIIGIYDCDSLPSFQTLKYVAIRFMQGVRCVQQPLHYRLPNNDAKNPFCVANARSEERRV